MTNQTKTPGAMVLRELKCWSCKGNFTLSDHADCDGCCWKCGVEIDLNEMDITPAVQPPAVGGEPDVLAWMSGKTVWGYRPNAAAHAEDYKQTLVELIDRAHVAPLLESLAMAEHLIRGQRKSLDICAEQIENLQRMNAELEAAGQQGEPVPVAWMRFDDDQRAIFTRSKRSNNSEPLYAHPTAYRHALPATAKVDERAEFEKWHASVWPAGGPLNGRWMAWQARAKLNGVAE